MTDPARLIRAASALRETAEALRLLAPGSANDMSVAAETLDIVRATLAALPALGVQVAPPPPAPPARRRNLLLPAEKQDAAARADVWLDEFLGKLPADAAAPSNRAIFKAAKQDQALRLPRRTVEGAIFRRWPEREPLQ